MTLRERAEALLRAVENIEERVRAQITAVAGDTSEAWMHRTLETGRNTRAELITAIEAALKAVREEAYADAAKVCDEIRRRHSKARSYPLAMDGLAVECATAIRALATVEPKGTP